MAESHFGELQLLWVQCQGIWLIHALWRKVMISSEGVWNFRSTRRDKKAPDKAPTTSCGLLEDSPPLSPLVSTSPHP